MKILAIIFFVGILLDFFEYQKMNKKLKKIDNELEKFDKKIEYIKLGLVSIDKDIDYMILKLIKKRDKNVVDKKR